MNLIMPVLYLFVEMLSLKETTMKKELKKHNSLFLLLKKLGAKPPILKNLERPKSPPPYATDCGFDHGKPNEEKGNISII